MYQAIGISKAIQIPLYVAVAVSLFITANPMGFFSDIGIVRHISLTVLIAGALISVLGQTPLFPVLCRWCLSWCMPDIDGEYTVEIASNWSRIKAAREGAAPQGDLAPFTKQGTATIKARLYSIAIEFRVDDVYSQSETITVSVSRESEFGLILNYVYRSTQLRPKETDSGLHFGAARIRVPMKGPIQQMEGEYWTNRNWHQGLNTAGTIRYVKRSA